MMIEPVKMKGQLAILLFMSMRKENNSRFLHNVSMCIKPFLPQTKYEKEES